MLGHFLKHFKVTISECVMKEKTIFLARGMRKSDDMDNGDVFTERAGDLEIDFVRIGMTATWETKGLHRQEQKARLLRNVSIHLVGYSAKALSDGMFEGSKRISTAYQLQT